MTDNVNWGYPFSAFRMFLLIFLILFDCYHAQGTETSGSGKITPTVIDIGVVVDSHSPFGSMVSLCIEMAKSDFYSARPDYKTRIRLMTKDAEDVVDVNLAVRELLLQDQVRAILLADGLAQPTFLSELGRKARVPIISSTARTADFLPSSAQKTHFIRTAPPDSVQGHALADLFRTFGWDRVVILYEETQHGLLFLSHLKTAFQDIANISLARLVPVSPSSTQTDIRDELNVLNQNETTKVYVVHVGPSLGPRLFSLANELGMMHAGHAWVVTDTTLTSSDPSRDSMEGVVGVRPYVPQSERLDSFRGRWEIRRSILMDKEKGHRIMDLNVYGLWAYDTVIALIEAVERVGLLMTKGSTSLGPLLQKELCDKISVKNGLSGDFVLADGTRKPTAFEIVNVFGTGERRLGFWVPDQGIVRDLESPSSFGDMAGLKSVVWPGDSVTKPKGWAVPPVGPLRVGVPGLVGFPQFVNVTAMDPLTNEANATGFAVDIFLAALKQLPFHVDYKFFCYNGTAGDSNWTFDDMLHQIPAKRFDMIVGDTTIWFSRAEFVDFSLPYAESSVVLLVKNDKEFDKWTFTKPLSQNLWVAIVGSCVVMGLVIWILEQRAAHHNLERPRKNYLTPLAVLAFPERDMISNRWSLFLLVCWLFAVYILMQSFTANLSAILTVDQVINSSASQFHHIGHREGSFVKRYLTEKLGINVSSLKSYNSPEDLHERMQSGEIEAAVEEIPYMKIMINRYGPRYKIVRTLYRTGGLGFAFPLGSPLAAYFSRAMLNVVQGPEMAFIEQKNFGPGYSSRESFSPSVSQGTSGLSFNQFAGLFIIVGSATVFAIVCSEFSVILSGFGYIKRRIFRPGRVAEGIQMTRTKNLGEVSEDEDARAVGGEIGN